MQMRGEGKRYGFGWLVYADPAKEIPSDKQQ